MMIEILMEKFNDQNLWNKVLSCNMGVLKSYDGNSNGKYNDGSVYEIKSYDENYEIKSYDGKYNDGSVYGMEVLPCNNYGNSDEKI